jgi:bacteriophage exclusion system BrxA-like protein
MKPDSHYRTYLQKGGALLDDMRLLVRGWEEGEALVQRRLGISENILAKRTRVRVYDTYRCAFAPRFLDGDPPEAWRVVRPLEDRQLTAEILRPVYYWVTARGERVLYDFVCEELWARSRNPERLVSTRNTAQWIRTKLAGESRSWTPAVTDKVARGMLAALRDFGILEGADNKRIAATYLPVESFAYLAFVLHSLGSSGNHLVNHPDWRLFLLAPNVVERFFLEAHQDRLLSFAAAGNTIRIEFPATTLEEMADVIAKRTT